MIAIQDVEIVAKEVIASRKLVYDNPTLNRWVVGEYYPGKQYETLEQLKEFIELEQCVPLVSCFKRRQTDVSLGDASQMGSSCLLHCEDGHSSRWVSCMLQAVDDCWLTSTCDPQTSPL